MIYHQTQSMTVSSEDESFEIMCDIQPLGSGLDYQKSYGLFQQEYGLESNSAIRIFTEPCKKIKNGMLAVLKGNSLRYIIKYAEHWDDYTTALLDELPQAVQASSGSKNHGEAADDIYGGGFY